MDCRGEKWTNALAQYAATTCFFLTGMIEVAGWTLRHQHFISCRTGTNKEQAIMEILPLSLWNASELYCQHTSVPNGWQFYPQISLKLYFQQEQWPKDRCHDMKLDRSVKTVALESAILKFPTPSLKMSQTKPITNGNYNYHEAFLVIISEYHEHIPLNIYGNNQVKSVSVSTCADWVLVFPQINCQCSEKFGVKKKM